MPTASIIICSSVLGEIYIFFEAHPNFANW